MLTCRPVDVDKKEMTNVICDNGTMGCIKSTHKTGNRLEVAMMTLTFRTFTSLPFDHILIMINNTRWEYMYIHNNYKILRIIRYRTCIKRTEKQRTRLHSSSVLVSLSRSLNESFFPWAQLEEPTMYTISRFEYTSDTNCKFKNVEP